MRCPPPRRVGQSPLLWDPLPVLGGVPAWFALGTNNDQ